MAKSPPLVRRPYTARRPESQLGARRRQTGASATDAPVALRAPGGDRSTFLAAFNMS